MDGALIIKLFALGTIVFGVFSMVILGLYFYKRGALYEKICSLFGHFGFEFLFVLSLGATGGALFLSNVMGLEPCPLCWWQRVFMIPQLFLFGFGMFNKDRRIADYAIALSLPGAAIALYQHYLQMGGSALTPCGGAEAVDCATRSIFEFGFVTLPLMSFVVFISIIVVSLWQRRI